MENAMVKVFENSEFGKVRMMDVDGQMMFGGSDVAKALGYARPADAITANCKGSVVERVLTSGGMQEVKFITEGDVYRLIIRSRLPEAQKFEHWLFDEALPAMRKGEVSLPNFNNPVEAARAWADAEEAKQIAETKVAELAPKADFYDDVMDDTGFFTLNEAAKMLHAGIHEFLALLRSKKILMSSGRKVNVPYQSQVNNGNFVIKYRKPEGSIYSKPVVYVTDKGFSHIRQIWAYRHYDD